jgi:GR25 family glycosyltransferase involved in LPS biosynthesis
MSASTQPTSLINQLFPHKVCINLDRRIERWERMQDKFQQHGIHAVRRFAAVDGDTTTIPTNWPGTPGAYGCLLSHLEVVREARRLGLPNILIFEDDVVFDDQFEQKFSEYIQQLPADWDMLFFGALHKDELIKVSENVGRITQSNSTYACALRETVFDAFIELNSKGEEVLDVNSLVLQKQFNCYCFLPHLAWVEDAYSDAQQKSVNHWYLRESLVLFGPQVDCILSDATLVLAYNGRSTHAEANLKCLLEYYDHFFSPYLAIVIVEEGSEPTLDREFFFRAKTQRRKEDAKSLNCDYIFLQHDGDFDPKRCFAAGARHADADRQYFILSDSDIYLETLDIRANLRMCERYDHVTGFSRIIDLSSEASKLLRATKSTRGLEIKNDHQDDRPAHCHFLNRRAIQILEQSDGSLADREQLRAFQSPNSALRLAV